jgi:hypothetical protein
MLARERPLLCPGLRMPVLDGGMLRGMAKDAPLNGVPVPMMSSIPEATVAERCRVYSAFMRKPLR